MERLDIAIAASGSSDKPQPAKGHCLDVKKAEWPAAQRYNRTETKFNYFGPLRFGTSFCRGYKIKSKKIYNLTSQNILNERVDTTFMECDSTQYLG